MLNERLAKARHIPYNLFTAKLDAPRKALDHVRTIKGRDTTKMQRLRSSIHLAAKIGGIAGIDLEREVHNILYNDSNLPLSAKKPELVGYGGECFVFKIDHENPRVVKVDMSSIKMSTDEKIARVKELENEHAQIKEWFGNIDRFVLPSSFLIGKMPYRGKAAVGVVQPYVEDMRGVFEDFEEEELVELFEHDADFRNSFIAVADKVDEVYSETNSGIDLGGIRNVVIVNKEGKNHIILIDSCDVVDFSPYRTRSQRLRKKRFEARKKRLDQLSYRAKEIESSK